jgi:glucosyl-3-phosphoglycerate synthase
MSALEESPGGPKSASTFAGGRSDPLTMLPVPDARLDAVVVIPARDEALLIETCLLALARQREVEPESFEVIVVLDGCRDATGEIVRTLAASEPRLRLHAVELIDGQGVGRARKLGMDIACERLLGLGRGDGLIASTDADSIVAEDWLARQVELARGGAHAIGGYIELQEHAGDKLAPEALLERERQRRERMQAVLRDGLPSSTSEHHQFSGASLALTAETYRRCGGLPVRAALEDEALERELKARGVPIHRSLRVSVRTSARVDGRAPRGLARDLARTSWRARRSYSAEQFSLERLLAAKRVSVAVVLPTREVVGTIGPIAEQAARLRDVGLFDEVLVVDAASADGTAAIAHAAGLTVVQEDELSGELGPARGKGDAMWRATRVLDSDIVAFLDTDTEGFGEHFFTGLLGPLLCEPEVQFVKGFFRRPFRADDILTPHGGGRVTELMARPLLNLHAPDLAVFDQPLAGETAARRELLEQLPFSAGYGVEIAMLIDAWRLAGLDALAQVDLGERQNRHQPLRELSAMAYAVLVAAQTRFLGADFADAHACGSISLPAIEARDAMETRAVTVEERPPLNTLGERRDLARAAVHYPGER